MHNHVLAKQKEMNAKRRDMFLICVRQFKKKKNSLENEELDSFKREKF